MKLATASTTILSSLCADGKAPEWIMLFPAGLITAQDGRQWVNDDPAQVADKSLRGVDLPIDWEHAADHKAPKGEEAPAAAWIDQLEVRDGAVWAHVSWTDAGRASVESRSYRYVSPSFLHDAGGHVRRLLGAGLVNRPAITTLPALASGTTSDPDMEKALLDALGLAAGATAADAVMAIGKLRGDLQAATASVQQPDPTKFVPKADLELALARASAAETKLEDNAKAAAEAKATAAVDSAIAAGKIAPVSKDHYLALARERPTEVEALFATLPPLGLAQVSDKGGAPPVTVGQLTAEQKALCAQTGVSEADFLKALG
ncbi:phage protease [Kaistia sp. MMO-174]|uniref:phage protease n=1 Tax=Kaistia sp. MMO-174 TaxID=3081256 RepID=UPI00301B4594